MRAKTSKGTKRYTARELNKLFRRIYKECPPALTPKISAFERAPSPWAAIDAIVNANPEPTGPEWFTAQQYAMRYGGNTDAITKRLKRDSRFERWTGLSNSARRVINKYRLKT